MSEPMLMQDGRVRLFKGDSRDVLRELPDNSIDSVVTDPPYALVSISKRFGKERPRTDSTVSKSDAHQRFARGFMGKTWDNEETAFAAEFWAEVMRVLKPGGHVLAFGGTRTYHRLACAIEDAGFEIRDQIGWLYGSGFPKSHNMDGEWEGWGTALKPAWEPIAVARKPLDGTNAENLARWGVGALNIDGCRVELSEGDDPRLGGKGDWSSDKMAKNVYEGGYAGVRVGSSPLGRWPANVIHDGSDEVLAAFPGAPRDMGGSAARFFYCAKASRADRNENVPPKPDGKPGNDHPTVKPTDLMRYLCRLVTPPGGTVLDPFMGSGSTGRGAVLEGFQFVGVEREDEYMPIATARITWAVGHLDRPDVPKPAKSKQRPANDNLLPDMFAEATHA